MTDQVVCLTEKALYFFFFFNCIGCLNENADYNKYCDFKEFSQSICEFKMCDFNLILLYCGSFKAEFYCYEQGNF